MLFASVYSICPSHNRIDDSTFEDLKNDATFVACSGDPIGAMMIVFDTV
jgi:hypothetical protein